MSFVCFFLIMQIQCTQKASDVDCSKGFWTNILWEKTEKEECGIRFEICIFVFRGAQGKVQTILVLLMGFTLFLFSPSLILCSQALFWHECILTPFFFFFVCISIEGLSIFSHSTISQRQLLFDRQQPIWTSHISSPFKMWNQKNMIDLNSFSAFANM